MLCVNTTLNCMTAHDNGIGDNAGKLLACRDAQLRLHEVNAGDELRNWVLHLDARVHFDEMQAAIFVHQEFNRAGVLISNVAQAATKSFADLFSATSGLPAGRSLFNEFLVTALNGALAFAQ